MKRANVFTVDFEYDPEDPAGYHSGVARVGRAVGGKELAVKLFEVPPGESVCPYHYEYVEEWLLVLDGAVAVRSADGEEALGRGEIVCFPAGSRGAHKVMNRCRAPARVLMFSSGREPSVAVYPDSDKLGVWPGDPEDNVILRRADGHVDYWEGER